MLINYTIIKKKKQRVAFKLQCLFIHKRDLISRAYQSFFLNLNYFNMSKNLTIKTSHKFFQNTKYYFVYYFKLNVGTVITGRTP